MNNYNVKIISDGGICHEHIELLYNNGVDIVVGGTSLLFNNKGFANNLNKLRNVHFKSANRITQYVEKGSQDISYKACVLKEIDRLELCNKTLRYLEKNEVVVKVHSCGICGSDIGRVFKKGMYSKNLVPGHEFAGIVVKTNECDEDLVNKRAAIYPLIPCGKCYYCKSEKYNLCEYYDYLGSRSDGGFSELVIVPKDNLVFIPNNVSYDEAALIEPLAVAFRGVEKLANLINSDVLILGLGPIGILSGMVCKKLGARTVFGVDRNQYKGEIANEVGFDEYIFAESDLKDKKFNIMIDCSGSSELINTYISYLIKESSILLLGNHENSLTFSPEMMSKILRSEFKFISSWNSNNAKSNNEWQACVNYLARGDFNLKPLITHKYPLDAIIDVFNKINVKEIKSLKVIINPN